MGPTKLERQICESPTRGWESFKYGIYCNHRKQFLTSWWRIWSKKPNVTEKGNIPDIMLDEVVGVIRGSEKRSIFVPANDPNSFQWFYVDVAGIARTYGLPKNTIYIEAVN